MDLPPDFRDLLEEFERGAVECVLVGGYAVAFHGRPRATKDIDFVLRGTSENLGRAARALERFGASPVVIAAIASMSETDVVYMGEPPMRVDFLRSIDGVLPHDLFAHAIAATLDGVRVDVISLDDLISNKRAVGRPRDLDDATFLERVRTKRKTP